MVWLATLKKAAGWGLAIGLLVMANWSWAGCTEPALVQQAKRSSAADDAQLRVLVALPDTLNLQQRRPDAQLRY